MLPRRKKDFGNVISTASTNPLAVTRQHLIELIEFDKATHMRLRHLAPVRPRGFYFAKIKLGRAFVDCPVSRLLKQLGDRETGCGAEGIQMLAISNPHIGTLTNKRLIPFMSFADYEVAPYGYNVFFNALQMFKSNNTLGLDIGHVDRNYPLFGIPVLRFSDNLLSEDRSSHLSS